MAAANKVPGFCQGVPLSCASPMQIGMPITSPWKTVIHGTTTEEVLLCGATVLCTLQQEANFLGQPLLLTANHLKMMNSMHNLDSVGLHFICESIEALQKERMPAQPLLGYTTPQLTDLLSSADSPMLQEVFRAASNLDTMIAGPPQVQPIQQPTQDCLPDPKIEDAIPNM